MKVLTDAQKELLSKPLPAEALSQHPSKSFLTTIKAIYVTERLNDVFGIGAWQIKTTFQEKAEKMVVVKVEFSVPEYGIYYECFGGNDNADLGDAYKGATTDAITKIGSYLGIAADVFKGKANVPSAQNNAPQVKKQASNKHIDFKEADSINDVQELVGWYNENMAYASPKQAELLKTICAKRKEKIMKGENGMNR